MGQQDELWQGHDSFPS
uniref:Uncharacterized protein n=1 Tax=Arundo donax TaxID=35708 RepID=A0A0A9AT62_ARUDO